MPPHGHARGHQRLHIPIDRTRRDTQTRGNVASQVNAPVAQDLHHLQQAVTSAHLFPQVIRLQACALSRTTDINMSVEVRRPRRALF